MVVLVEDLDDLVVHFNGIGDPDLRGLGVLGEYVGRILNETKGRPIYIIRDRYDDGD